MLCLDSTPAVRKEKIDIFKVDPGGATNADDAFRPGVGSWAGLLFDIAVGIGLFEVGPKVVDFLILLYAGENHFRSRDFSLGILDVFLEGRLIPNDARILVGI